MPTLPIPAAARYSPKGDPSPPAPIMRTLAFFNRRCPAIPTSGMMRCREYRSISSFDRWGSSPAGTVQGGKPTGPVELPLGLLIRIVVPSRPGRASSSRVAFSVGRAGAVRPPDAGGCRARPRSGPRGQAGLGGRSRPGRPGQGALHRLRSRPRGPRPSGPRIPRSVLGARSRSFDSIRSREASKSSFPCTRGSVSRSAATRSACFRVEAIASVASPSSGTRRWARRPDRPSARSRAKLTSWEISMIPGLSGACA